MTNYILNIIIIKKYFTKILKAFTYGGIYLNGEVIIKKQTRAKKKGLKLVLIALVSLLILLTAIVLAGYLFIKKGLPTIDGELTVSGLENQVTVYRDENGVPHIEAQTERDLYIAQGYVTAQDRLFQMDLSRRQASGELSEVIGASTVDKDKFFRALGLRRAAEASYGIYSVEAQEVLNWYAEGVNAYINEAIESNSLPIEFTLAGYKPREWTAIDSLTIGKYMAYDLGGHWEGQAFRHHMAFVVPEDKLLELFPVYPEDGATVIQALKENPMDLTKSFATLDVPDEFNGSNNWVVSGDKTESGFPYLANDPHLSLATPSIWYEVHLNSPEVNVNGVIFAGIPGIILGRNEKIAWGVTNVGPDVQDLYIEKRNPENENEFLYMDKWEQATVIDEQIKVKDEETIPYKVTITRHGPIISEFAHDNRSDTALALKWTALSPSTELEAVLRFNKASNWEEFKDALTYFHTPAQNFVFADKEGNIAYRANGHIPIRKKGDSSVPVPGWTDEYEWEGFIPWEELPTVINPKEGFIATANNKIVTDDYPYHITHTWAQPYRQQRIMDVLSGNEKLSVEDMKKLQFDQYNLQAEEFVPILVGMLKEDNLREVDKNALKLLSEWDFNDNKDLGAPLIFHLWMAEIGDVIFESKVPKELNGLFEGRAQIVDEMIRKADKGEESLWIQDAGGIDKVISSAYKRTIDKITEIQGNTITKWSWGEYHAVPFNHPLSAIKPLNYLFNFAKPVPMGGSRVTVAAAGWSSTTGLVNHGGAWRTVVDLANLSKSYNVVGPGQSGHVLSNWYNDQIGPWTTGGYHTTYTESYENQKYKLLLVPGK
ncbi:penicillin acylase family protein [Bacillus luteolus]|uniref:Penicillin acylase family protein n=1 Tax=Litchfieldia luteola TaxID=682179 RepID=A0ABR9QIT0_9BACI|nr:penicillin acylase family protein [Cytobacillus luteolus]